MAQHSPGPTTTISSLEKSKGTKFSPEPSSFLWSIIQSSEKRRPGRLVTGLAPFKRASSAAGHWNWNAPVITNSWVWLVNIRNNTLALNPLAGPEAIVALTISTVNPARAPIITQRTSIVTAMCGHFSHATELTRLYPGAQSAHIIPWYPAEHSPWGFRVSGS